MIAEEIAKTIHGEVCIPFKDHMGVNPSHDWQSHMLTAREYEKVFKDSEFNGVEVAHAIMEFVEWPDINHPQKWPGHPAPHLVMEYLQLRGLYAIFN